MGLDGVELILEVEDRFGIRIEDDEAASARTVGELRDLVASKLHADRSRRCLTSHVFYRLRASLGSELGIGRNRVVPSAGTESLLPCRRRRQAWRDLSQGLGWDLPDLRRADWLRASLMLGIAGTVAPAIIGGVLGLLPAYSAWTMALGVIPGLWLALKLTTPLAVHVPASCSTVDGLVRVVLADNFRRISDDRQAWNERELWSMVKTIIVEQLGVDAGEVTPNARFVEELGVD